RANETPEALAPGVVQSLLTLRQCVVHLPSRRLDVALCKKCLLSSTEHHVEETDEKASCCSSRPCGCRARDHHRRSCSGICTGCDCGPSGADACQWRRSRPFRCDAEGRPRL